MGRARAKWGFLKLLTKPQRRRLVKAILRDVQKMGLGYVSKGEITWLKRDLRMFLDSGFPDVALTAANQPFNVQFWKPEFLKPLGIKPGQPPKKVEVWVVGKFAHLDGTPNRADYIRLRRSGLDGMFSSGGFVGNPEMVIWRNRAVIRFGGLYRK